MTGPMSPEAIEHVKQMAKSEEMQALLDALADRYIHSWRTSSPLQTDQRDHLYRMVQAVEGLRSEIKSVATDELVAAYNKRLSRGSGPA